MADVMTKRIASWLITAVLATAAFVGCRMLPGGNLTSELRWRLRPGSSHQGLNDAVALLTLAHSEQPEEAAHATAALLVDPDVQVRHRACTTIRDVAYRSSPLSPGIGDGLRTAFAVMSDEEREQYGDCWAELLYLALESVEPKDISEDERRWATAYFTIPLAVSSITAASGHLPPLFMLDVDTASADGELQLPNGLVLFTKRLLLKRPAGYAPSRLNREATTDLLRMLDDPAPRVRWGAGFLLICAGDARGAEAVEEWPKTEALLQSSRDAVNAFARGMIADKEN